jgi:hypothetical protein
MICLQRCFTQTVAIAAIRIAKNGQKILQYPWVFSMKSAVEAGKRQNPTEKLAFYAY